MYDKFMRNIKNKNPAKNTVHNLKVVLESTSKYIGKPLELAEWDDLLGYFEHMREEEYKENTVSMHKQKLKQFFLFCFDETDDGKYRKLAKKLSAPKIHNNLSPIDIVYPDEVKRMLNVATLERDRCVIAVLFESGMRIGELLNLRIKDTQIDEKKEEVTFHIPEMPGCKTGARSVLCLEIYPYIEAWLKCHPNPAFTEKFIPVSEWTIRAITERAYHRANIEKPDNPHMLRHSAITNAVAIGMPETQIKYRFWGNIGSVMLATYVHLNEQITAKGYRDAKGMNGNGNTVINPLAVRCVRCGRMIETGTLCIYCKDAKKLEESNAELKERLDKRDADYEDLKKDMEKIQEFIKMGGMELLKNNAD